MDGRLRRATRRSGHPQVPISTPDELFSDLVDAVKQGTLDEVQELLNSGADIKTVDKACNQNLVFFAAARNVTSAGSDAPSTFLEFLVVEHGLEAAAVDSNGQTPLFYAAREGAKEACAYLISARCAPDHADNFARSPLFWAAQVPRDANTVRLLLELRSDASRLDSLDQTPLMYASWSSVPCTQELLEARCNPNLRDFSGWTALFFAAQKGAAAQVKLLIKYEADPHLDNRDGQKCLFQSARGGWYEVCKLLVETYEVDPMKLDAEGRSALSMVEACQHRENRSKTYAYLEECMRQCRQRQAAQITSAKWALYNAVRQGDYSEVSRLIELRASPRVVAVGEPQRVGQNLIHLAAARKSEATEVCMLLARHRVDATLVDKMSEQTPLFYAVRANVAAGGLECARFLINARCSASHADWRGEAPLMYAVQRPEPDCAELLLSNAADPNHRNLNGETATMFAARSGYVACLRALIAARANADARDDAGRTALWNVWHGGTGPETTMMTQLLLKNRCDPNVTDHEGMTALMVFARAGHLSAVRAMVSACANVHQEDRTRRNLLDYAKMNSNQEHQANVIRFLVDECKVGKGGGGNAQGSAAADLARQPGDRKRPYSVFFRDDNSAEISPDTPEYMAALRRCLELKPWLSGILQGHGT